MSDDEPPRVKFTSKGFVEPVVMQATTQFLILSPSVNSRIKSSLIDNKNQTCITAL